MFTNNYLRMIQFYTGMTDEELLIAIVEGFNADMINSLTRDSKRAITDTRIQIKQLPDTENYHLPKLRQAYANYENHAKDMGLVCDLTQLQLSLFWDLLNEKINKYQNELEKINWLLLLHNKIEAILNKQALNAAKYQNRITFSLNHAMKSQLKLFKSPQKTSESRRKNAETKDEIYYREPRAFVKAMYKNNKHKRTSFAAKYIADELEKYIAQKNLPVDKTKISGSADWEGWVTNEIRKIRNIK